MNEMEICVRRQEAVGFEASVRWIPGKVGEGRERKTYVERTRNLVAHGDAREGK